MHPLTFLHEIDFTIIKLSEERWAQSVYIYKSPQCPKPHPQQEFSQGEKALFGSKKELKNGINPLESIINVRNICFKLLRVFFKFFKIFH